MPIVQQLINSILEAIPGAPFPETVDTIKMGDPAREATGIVTTFLASQSVLQKAVDVGANFIIVHEPTFYNHLDDTDWLKGDAVYQAKRQFIDEHRLTLWRLHDYWHSHQPDGIMIGVLRSLGWETYVEPVMPYLATIPAMSLT